jgi:hypothetical protein
MSLGSTYPRSVSEVGNVKENYEKILYLFLFLEAVYAEEVLTAQKEYTYKPKTSAK